MTNLCGVCSTAFMSRLPIAIPVRGRSFEDTVLAFSDIPGFFCIDARRAHASSGRCSIVSALPTGTFSIAGAFVTTDGHATIDNPYSALTRFAGRAAAMARDPYLPFSGGIAGYIGFEGARAFRGKEPARGFSRHSQCRLGIYPVAALFDHAEGTATLVANGNDADEAEERANIFLEILKSGPRRTWESASQSREPPDLRVAPDDAELKEILLSARQWLRSESVDRIHLVRHSQRFEQEGCALREFLDSTKDGELRAMFTHEGSAYMVSSSEALIRTEDRALRSTLSFAADEECDRWTQRSISEEVASRLAQLCEGGRPLSVRLDPPTESARRMTFEGTLSHEISAIDALLGLLPSHRLTGAPHERALDFIDANESIHRSLYGGAFGTMDSSRLSFSTVQKISSAADGSLGTTVGLDVTEDVDVEETLERFASLIREAHPQTD